MALEVKSKHWKGNPMLESIRLKNVGPAPKMEMVLAERLNLITGNNGLGKSFLLDVAWWVLTRTWAREMVVPRPGATAEIAYQYTKKTKSSYHFVSKYEADRVRWSVKASRPPIPGLILYAQVDGGFSVWDPMRNYWIEDSADRPNAFLFTPDEVWQGNEHCRGVLEDWLLWQAGSDRKFKVLTQVLEALSPSPSEKILPGDPREITIKDKGPTPTIRMPYGEDVPLSHASSGMRRIIALAYLLTWAWHRHEEAAKLRGELPAREIVFLVDEIEGHLHPQWQRRVVPALLGVMKTLTGEHGTKTQLIAATHSPLVLASVEPIFDARHDAWFDLDLEHQEVLLRKREYFRRGEIDNWLTSPAFDLKEPRGSVEAEDAIQEALALARQPAPSTAEIRRVDLRLQAVLGDTDRFWVRWTSFRDGLHEEGRAKP
ncbi:AAA family ATPase [Castellaniella caeni]|uniref:AAA family ATPase n=1 Tax=Castellaniella caeni TaxID=266123 RepID=UPI002155C6D8|nr:ATP-binding protein [Castellaniella caeni]